MKRERFALALERLEANDGVLFERLASAFAAVELGTLRTVAATSGDGGKDAVLYIPLDDERVVLQYSVTKYAADKIRRTAKRIKSTTPSAIQLIYVTSEEIGIRADDLRRELRRDYALSLDIWDRHWFLDRLNTHPQREEAAEELARLKVDPLLASHEVISSQAPSMSTEEERTAAVFLAIQYADESRDKGLTKICYDSLVRAALRNTDSSHRMHRAEVHAAIRQMIPTQSDLERYVDSSLSRLSKSVIKHHKQADEFCLSYEETSRIKDRLSNLELDKSAYHAELLAELTSIAPEITEMDSAKAQVVCDLMASLIDRLLLEKGEAFASALTGGQITDVTTTQVESLLSQEFTTASPREIIANHRSAIIEAVRSALVSPGDAAHRYLQRWVDSYTLFSLLRATPDVQKTVVKLFSHGRIWIDSNMLLPVIAEELVDPELRHYTELLRATREAGLALRVTSGIIEELSMHMRRSMAYARTISQGRTWDGEVPFLAVAHALSGSTVDTLAGWIENFRGDAQPEDDVREYLEEVHGIRLHDLRSDAESADVTLRGAVQEIWAEAKTKSRSARTFNPESVRRLVAHDVECYLGIVQLRRAENRSSWGYNSWWLTLDGVAYRIHKMLQGQILGTIPSPPVMSPDFLLRYLEIGPLRRQLSKESSKQLPLVNDISFLEGVSPQILQTVERIRKENANLPPRVLRRKIRDALNSMRSTQGQIAEGGIAYVESEVLAAISSNLESAKDGGAV
ncbi:hypothetical protein AAH991_38425 [Microbispora sp. ZYX-F-249]|uniref:Restriction endonuclease type IV Mrr domain-containing protein n=1 Tax=Microbispora maris TaxID=3144104 RepID=A0ABV0B0J8_9ACTN